MVYLPTTKGHLVYADENGTRCQLCGERFSPNDERAEMYDPATDAESVICHASCGLARDMEVA